jgi:YidC/Oxa1 family membrane protein insertase
MFTTFFYTPIYNALVYIIGHVPGGDVGVGVIILTLVINIVLAPLKLGASRTQRVMREIQGEQDAIKKKHTDPREQMAAMSALYKKHNINPFSSFLAVLVQIPVVIGLYQVFVYGFPIDPAYLYSFVSAPEVVSTMLLGVVDLTQKSIVLAAIAAITQFALAQLMPEPSTSGEASFSNDFAKSLHFQSKYFLPLLIGFVAYTVSSVVALYLIVTNVASICIELYPYVKGFVGAKKTA